MPQITIEIHKSPEIPLVDPISTQDSLEVAVVETCRPMDFLSTPGLEMKHNY